MNVKFTRSQALLRQYTKSQQHVFWQLLYLLHPMRRASWDQDWKL